jgi:hypothetical protein
MISDYYNRQFSIMSLTTGPVWGTERRGRLAPVRRRKGVLILSVGAR